MCIPHPPWGFECAVDGLAHTQHMGNLHRGSAGTVERITMSTMYQVSPAVEAGERGNVCVDGNPCSVPDVLFLLSFWWE